jgi:hypothetical protein
VSVPTVKLWVKELTKISWLQREKREGKNSKTYKLNPELFGYKNIRTLGYKNGLDKREKYKITREQGGIITETTIVRRKYRERMK